MPPSQELHGPQAAFIDREEGTSWPGGGGWQDGPSDNLISRRSPRGGAGVPPDGDAHPKEGRWWCEV